MDITATPQTLDGAAEVSAPSASLDLETRRIAAVRRGDGRAFAALVRPHLAMLHRVAARGCGPALAEDVVQDTLTIAYQQIDRYTPGTSLKSWLAAIASQRAWTSVRGEIRRRAREDHAATPTAPTTPEQDLRARQLAERVRSALARLPEKRRLAATLRLDAKLSYAEIATALGSTEGSTRVLVHMALKALREELSDMLPAAAAEEQRA